MSPEYALKGRFSEKSDVFSFGVLILEIVSGRRNNSFNDEETLSLLSYVRHSTLYKVSTNVEILFHYSYFVWIVEIGGKESNGIWRDIVCFV